MTIQGSVNRRAFSAREKYIRRREQNGRCAACGISLLKGFHADHIVPFSKGGETASYNLQLLCAQCNLMKGARILNIGRLPLSFESRPWQREALLEWSSKCATSTYEVIEKDFLCAAVPGSGKTKFALRLAHDLISDGHIRTIIIVSPSRAIQQKWCDDASELGIELVRDFSMDNDTLRRDRYAGMSLTYSQLLYAITEQESLRSRDARTGQPAMLEGDPYRKEVQDALVIFDEIHHVATAPDEAGMSAWCKWLHCIFDDAKWRLLLSGTPFREDGRGIPFVRYEQVGGVSRAAADFSYPYMKALNEGVVREVFFPLQEGEARYLLRNVEYSRLFSDDVPTSEEGAMIRTICDPAGDYIRDSVRDANAHLDEMRANGHINAAGLIACIDQEHARRVADVVRQVTGEAPTVVVSDDDEPHEEIKRFRDGSARWIVAVRMVAEGVDIPRLRVGVYATNIMTEMYFRQFVGRVMRMQNLPDDLAQSAYVWLPKVPRLVDLAKAFMAERDQTLMKPPPGPPRPLHECHCGTPPPESTFVSLGNDGVKLDSVIHRDGITQEDDLGFAKTCLLSLGMKVDLAQQVQTFKILKWLQSRGTSVATSPESLQTTVKTDRRTEEDRANELKRTLSRLVGRIGMKRIERQQLVDRAMKDEVYKAVNRQLQDMHPEESRGYGRSVFELGEPELIERVKNAQRLLREEDDFDARF
jgi:superfamily II DNA or RNA helicase